MKKNYTIIILLCMSGISQIHAQCTACDQAFHIGTNTVATGTNSFAGGYGSATSATNSFVFGDYSSVTQSGGIAIGSNLFSNAVNSYVFGQYLTGSGANSITIGTGISSLSQLVNTKNNSIMFGVTNKPSLTIVKQTGLVGSTMGYVGIGTDNPEEMAHVVGKLLIERTETTASSLQFKHPENAPGPSGSVEHYWNIYSDKFGLKFNTVTNVGAASTQRMIISGDGVGIGSGITTPLARLHVDNNILAEGDITTLDKFRLAPAANSISGYWELSRTSFGLNFAYMNNTLQNILFIGNNGLLCAKEVRVQLTGAECWPDFVFGKYYKLLPLKDVEQFITENQHLPNVPSSAEVESNGVELGKMNAILLQKVEELTLYILDLQKQIIELKETKND